MPRADGTRRAEGWWAQRAPYPRSGRRAYTISPSLISVPGLSMSVSVASCGLLASDPSHAAEAAELARLWGLPQPAALPETGHVLVWDGQTLSLCCCGKGAPGPVRVDWAEGRFRQRLKTSGRSQPLARAVGFKPGFVPHVLDATAGLGQDAFVLAWLGARVDCVERSPVAAALLSDGLRRAATDASLSDVAQRLTLQPGDAAELMRNWPVERRPDTVYLDPMYPDHGRTALSSRNMHAFQQVIGADEDADKLLERALAVARRRVVVKRPRKAPLLAGAKPFTQLVGESTRYDIYMVWEQEHVAG